MLLTAIVLTYNEAANIEACLTSIRAICDEIFIVDSGSTDGTIAIGERYGKVYQHAFETHAMQWDWALSSLPINTPWVLALDADQRITPELLSELDSLFRSGGLIAEDLNGLYVRRRQIFRGRWIKYGGYYSKYLLKIFRLNAVIIDTKDLVDHHFYVSGRTSKLACDIIENNAKENRISFWIDKHNRYARLLAAEELKRISASEYPVRPAVLGNPDQRTLWLKCLWHHLPKYVRPVLYFCFRYFIRLGFLDGKQGFIFHFLQAFWFRMLVDVNREELESIQNSGLASISTGKSAEKVAGV